MKQETTHGVWLSYSKGCRCKEYYAAFKIYSSWHKLRRRIEQILDVALVNVQAVETFLNSSIENQIEDYIMRRIPTTCRNCNRKFNKLLRGGKCKECIERSSFSWYKKPQYDKSDGIWYKPSSTEYIRIRTRLPAYWTRDGKLVFCEDSMRYYCDPATYEVRQWSTDHAMNEELKEVEKDVECGKMEEREI